MTNTQQIRASATRQLIVVDGDGQRSSKLSDLVSMNYPDGSSISAKVPTVFVVDGSESRPNTTDGVAWFGGTTQPVNMLPGDLWYSSTGHNYQPS